MERIQKFRNVLLVLLIVQAILLLLSYNFLAFSDSDQVEKFVVLYYTAAAVSGVLLVHSCGFCVEASFPLDATVAVGVYDLLTRTFAGVV